MKWRWMIALLLLLTVPITGFAANCRGHIRLKMVYDGEPVPGGTVTLYDVSDSPEGIGPLEMLVYVKELGLQGTEKPVDSTGFVAFDNLPAGLYFLVQHKAPAGFYPINPFLVELLQIPGGTQIASVDGAPKLEPEKKLPQTGQLVWPVWLLFGVGICTTGIGLLIWKRE